MEVWWSWDRGFALKSSGFDAHAIDESMLPLSFSMSGESMVDMQNTERDKVAVIGLYQKKFQKLCLSPSQVIL